MARSGDPLTLSREDLFELVWSKPMTELAQDFGLSDVALANVVANSAYLYRGAVTGRVSRPVRRHGNRRFGNGPTT
jgi:hypothetical protein